MVTALRGEKLTFAPILGGFHLVASRSDGSLCEIDGDESGSEEPKQDL
jgi:hypothetical protein